MSTLPTIRLHLLVARAAPRILIIRRGPSRVYHLALWRTDSDTVEHGSWFRGQLYFHRCDLSWDGEWLVYFAMGPTRQHYSWTAVSRPPWVRAELFYPKSDTWNGGGVWDRPDMLWLNMPAGSPPREGDPAPRDLGFSVRWGRSEYGEDEGPLYRRLERDGWRRDDPPGKAFERRTAQGWMLSGGPEWVLQPTPELPALRMVHRGYSFNRGRVFTYHLEGYPELVDEQVSWAGYDGEGRLVVARGSGVERYTAADLRRGAPSFRYDLADLPPPPPPPPRPRQTIEPEAPAQLGPDGQGRYHFLGEPARRREAAGPSGHPIRGQDDLQALAPILREDRTWSFEKPQTYVVSEEGVFVLGGYINEHVDAAGGRPVLAAGEAVLEEQPDGSWAITALNNRSYGYMPGPESWDAVERALRDTGIAYPAGFSEIYPLEDSWAEVLAVLRS